MEEDNDDKDDTKRKSRNLSEKKRRDQFNLLVNDLSGLISSTSRKMDKSTVLKSTIAFLKNHNEVTDKSKVYEIPQDWKPSFLTNDEFSHLMLEALDGFIIIFSSNGTINHVSENVTSLLGYLPSDLLNMTIFDLAYEVDHEKLYNIFLNPELVIDPPKIEVSPETQINVFVHLKRGELDQVDATAYELVKLVGYLKKDTDAESTNPNTHSRSFSTDNCDKGITFVGTGRVQMPQLIREMSAIDPSNDEFTSKHSMEWKFIFLDQRAPPIIGYMPFEVLGTSGYDYYHFDDLDNIISCHEELMQKGEGKSCYYRFLTKGQQWIWLQSNFYISYHNVSSKPDYVVCTHKVISYVEVIKQNKLNSENKSKVTTKSTSATVTLRDIESATTVTGSGITAMEGNSIEKMPATTTTKSPEIDSSVMWPQRAVKLANYGSVASAVGLSSNIKRKRPAHTRGYESDYTSDSSSSRHSLMTHYSSQAKSQHNLSTHSQYQQQLNPISSHQHQHHQQQQHQQQQQQHQHNMQSVSHNKLLKMSHQATGLQLVSSPPTQFAQPSYPIRNQQLMGHTFLEPQQYISAIPIQPVIAQYPVLPSMTSSSDILPGVMMTPTQTQIQDQLQRKHDELQKMIFQQQDELRRVSEQLFMSRYTIIPTYNTPNQNRHFQLGSSSMDHQQQQQQQFVNYNFGMNDQLQSNQHEPPIHQPQQQQQLQVSQQQQPTQSLQQQMLPRNPPVPDLEEFGHEDIDAFLNAEALQPTLVLPSPSSTTINSQHQLDPHQQSTGMSLNQHSLGVQHDDSLMSYMQIPTEPTSTSNLNFQIGMNDDDSERRCDDPVAVQNRFNPYQTQNNQMPNELEILPYQMSQEQSQIIFNSPHTPGHQSQ